MSRHLLYYLSTVLFVVFLFLGLTQESSHLLGSNMPEHAVFQDFWARARSDSFVAGDGSDLVRQPSRSIDLKLVG